MTRTLIDMHPHLRLMWVPGGDYRGPWFGDCAYYGWRWWLGVGPVLLLIGRSVAGDGGVMETET